MRIDLRTKHSRFEVVSNINIPMKWFYPHLGIHFSFNWIENDGQFGFYLHLIFFSIYFDWFQSEQ